RDDLGPAAVADAVRCRGIVFEMVDSPAGRARTPKSDTAHDRVIGDQKLSNPKAFAAIPDDFVQPFGLDEGPGEAVENEAPLHVGLREAVLDDPKDEVVGDESTALHDRSRLEAELGPISDRLPEHVPGRDVRNGKLR